MTDTLLEAIREVLLLDEKRTQGEWVAPYYSGIYAGDLFVADTDPHDDCGPRPEHDAKFIAAAPTMASLLRQCMERMEADARDAERYRWLRDHDDIDEAEAIYCGTNSKYLDATIDAAIQTKEQGS